MASLLRPKSSRAIKPPMYKYEAVQSTLSSNSQPDSNNSQPQRRPRKDSRQQNSYHPGKEMTKEELSEWRAAERKKRNRLAAAASRNKLRQKERAGGLPCQAARRPRRPTKHQLHQQRPKERFTDSPYSTVTVGSDECSTSSGYLSSSGYTSSSSLDTPIPVASDPLYSHPSGPKAGPSPYPEYSYPSRVIYDQPTYYSYQAGMPQQSPYVTIVDSSFAFSSGGLHDKTSFNAHQARHNSASSNGFITRDAANGCAEPLLGLGIRGAKDELMTLETTTTTTAPTTTAPPPHSDHSDFDGLFMDGGSPPLSPASSDGMEELEEWVCTNFDVFTN